MAVIRREPQAQTPHSMHEPFRVATWIIVPVVSYFLALYVTSGLVWLLQRIGIPWSMELPVGAMMYRLMVYAVMIAILIAVTKVWASVVTTAQAGIQRLLEWKDVGFGLMGAVAYVILTMIILAAASAIHGFNSQQAQSLGVGPVYTFGSQLIVFVVLVIATPVFEELIFRGIIYGRLRRTKLPWWASALIVSALFGIAHWQWNVGLDVFALSLVACVLREVTGSIWSGIILHILKNLVAFYFTFVVVQSVIR